MKSSRRCTSEGSPAVAARYGATDPLPSFISRRLLMSANRISIPLSTIRTMSAALPHCSRRCPSAASAKSSTVGDFAQFPRLRRLHPSAPSLLAFRGPIRIEKLSAKTAISAAIRRPLLPIRPHHCKKWTEPSAATLTLRLTHYSSSREAGSLKRWSSLGRGSKIIRVSEPRHLILAT